MKFQQQFEEFYATNLNLVDLRERLRPPSSASIPGVVGSPG